MLFRSFALGGGAGVEGAGAAVTLDADVATLLVLASGLVQLAVVAHRYGQSTCRWQYNQCVPMMKLLADGVVELRERHGNIRKTDVRFQKHAFQDNKLEFLFRSDEQPT